MDLGISDEEEKVGHYGDILILVIVDIKKVKVHKKNEEINLVG